MDAMDLRGGSWQLITANNDVLNHLADRHDLQEVLEHWAGMLHPEGVVLTDVVSASDVRHNWDGVEQVYSDGVSFRCEVSHELVDRVGAVGRMVRRWWRCVDGAWLRAGLEEEVVRGVEREDIEAAAGAAGLHAELWDWDGGGVYEERTVRIGIVLRALNSGS
jgi:hypothetical protein